MSKPEYIPGGDLSTVEGRRSLRAFNLLRKLRDDGLIHISSTEQMNKACEVVDCAILLYVESEGLTKKVAP